jgi:hypothetical protein
VGNVSAGTIGLMVGSLVVSLLVTVAVGVAVYAADEEARACANGTCQCELP